jgi:hypothetical protein
VLRTQTRTAEEARVELPACNLAPGARGNRQCRDSGLGLLCRSRRAARRRDGGCCRCEDAGRD